MRERYPRVFDALVWPAVILCGATLLLNVPTISFLALERFGARHHHLAMIGASTSVTYTFVCPLAAWLGRRFGRRTMFLCGAAAYAVWGLLLAQTAALWHLALCQVFVATGGALLWPNVEVELARGREGPLLRKRLSIFNTTWCAGTAVGPLLGALLYPKQAVALGEAGRQAINLPFYVSVGVGAASLALFALWRVRLPSPGEGDRHAAGEVPRDPARLRAFRLMAYVGNFSCYIVIGVLRNLYEALARHQWADGEPARIYFVLIDLLAWGGTATFAVMFFAHRWSYRLKRLLAFQSAIVAALVVVALSGSVAASAVAFLVIGVASSFTYSGSLFYSIEGSDELSHKAGLHEAIIGAGVASGLLLTGFMPKLFAALGVESEYWLVRSPYLMAAGLFAVGIVAQAGIYAAHARQFAPMRRSASR